MLPGVCIGIEPFLVMIWAAIEEFRKECLGVFLGYRPTARDNNFYIAATIPLQSVRRGRKGKALTEVDQSKYSRERLEDFEKWLEASRISIIGDFHSHAEYRGLPPPIELSGFDKNHMAEDEIGMLVSISSRKKGKMPWETLSDGRVSGSLGRYDFLFSAYMLEKTDDEKDKNVEEENCGKKAHLLQIIAPSAIKMLNRMQLKK
jgi:hypothetical protein